MSKINFNIYDLKEINIEKLIEEETLLFDASKIFYNNGGELLKEIDAK